MGTPSFPATTHRQRITERLPPGHMIVVDPRVARAVIRAALDNDELLPGTRQQYLAASAELVRWIRPATGLIRCAQSVLADRTGLAPITVKRFFKWGREEGVLWRVFHQRFSPTDNVTGLAAGYVILGEIGR
ncbi:hypothetical protein IL38_23810 [Actinopolyspora erythraea]|uniref:Uncharacterized protein n=1 Tax=Actinopolyspora erythraea TaxID=414996 RepID=A0ABR4WYN8_9ACTN|nr:hypothetical protein [Actinopolyspora erythraea]KGI79338.1 hypothetical protein IL38_23810 [Actinopolyspora erythraea]